MSGWTLVIPVRRGGKTRLTVPGVDRAALARAMALDTIAAACDVAEVIVVTDDPFEGVRVVPDPGAGLAAAITAGLDAAGSGDRGVLLGDLPALRPVDLRAALEQAASVARGVVADAAGTGTTLVTARSGVELLPAFGDGSYARHRAAGFAPLAVPASSTVRHDVDTATDLDRAGMLGLGPRTTAVLVSRPDPAGDPAAPGHRGQIR